MPSINILNDRGAFTNQNHPNSNYSSYNKHYVTVGAAHGELETTNDYCQGWLGFDLSSIPLGATITSATLSFIFFGVTSNYGDITVKVRLSNSHSWGEDTITWNNAPTANASITFSSLLSTGGGDNLYSGDVTANVAASLAGNAVSWRLDTNGDDPTYGANLASRTNFALAVPTLAVTYTLAAAGSTALFFGSD